MKRNPLRTADKACRLSLRAEAKQSPSFITPPSPSYLKRGIRGGVISFIIILTLSGFAYAHGAMDRFWGEVPVDMLLSGDVLIVKPLIVPEGVTLTIDPGTVVRFEKFAGGNRIVVKGKLVAVGAKDKLIKFIPKDKGSGPWYGIEFVDSGRGRIERCLIQGATDGIRDPMKGATTKDVNFAR